MIKWIPTKSSKSCWNVGGTLKFEFSAESHVWMGNVVWQGVADILYRLARQSVNIYTSGFRHIFRWSKHFQNISFIQILYDCSIHKPYFYLGYLYFSLIFYVQRLSKDKKTINHFSLRLGKGHCTMGYFTIAGWSTRVFQQYL